ncbi:acyltransferase family protein [Flavobacterium sp. GA093]|uniref:Acyltransferase family protein n=1 Tax=Flavobacterium hydrocarbonoxydans TaxID=2683249 RepID=A0A6I4NTZ5_9FLAO|nr:acyltransferase [Flavobacterium hydrocarbonoxydans]MWB94504.1 acyltransferase family protein [Flavobacterium hydrocarbonoxydans]
MRLNNFDFLRFIFALLVVISHANVLSGYGVKDQWIFKLTNGQIELSNIGLNGFFILSGYLIFQSIERSKNVFDFYWKRILRLFPGLFVVLVLTVIFAPLVYQNSIPYLDNYKVLSYIPRNLSLFNLQYSIKGVFESNPYSSSINGSLWTICYEFSCYVLLSGLLIIIKKRKIVLLFLVSVFLLMIIGYNFFYIQLNHIIKFGMSGSHFFNLGTFFIGGSLFASLKIENFKNKSLLLVIVSILVVTSLYYNSYDFFKHILLTIMILLIGLMPVKYFHSFGKTGDPSYGIYIYSFPIQQTLIYFFNIGGNTLIIRSVLLSLLFGYFSWHLIEKKALLYKNLNLKLIF